jgi:hypothetical protein
MAPTVALVQKAARVWWSGGSKSLLEHSIKFLKVRAQHAARNEIDRIAESDITNAEKFSLIYRKKLWLKAAPHLNPDKTLSGQGSTATSTHTLRQALEVLLRQEGVETFLDAPCGDFNWMRDVNFPENCNYIGGDIVAQMVSNLQHRYGQETVGNSGSRKFIHLDLTRDELPQADIWLCKDCLQHLSHADVASVLRNFRKSRIKIALISNHTSVNSNIDIRTGQFRHLDLTLSPFNVLPPRQKLRDSPVDGEPRYIGVWYREDLAERLDI